MKTRAILFTIFAVTLFAIGTTVTLLYNSAPITNLIIFFFLALLTSLFGLFFFLLLVWNFMRYRGVPAWQSTLASARLSLLFAAFLTLALLLRSFHLWNIATGLVLVVAFGALDLLWRRRLTMKKS